MNVSEWIDEAERRKIPAMPAVIWLTRAEVREVQSLMSDVGSRLRSGTRLLCGTPVAIIDEPPTARYPYKVDA